MARLTHPRDFASIERRMLQQAHEGKEVTLYFPERGPAFSLRQRLYKLRRITSDQLGIALNITMPNPTETSDGQWKLQILPDDARIAAQLGEQLDQIEADDYLTEDEDSTASLPSALDVFRSSEGEDSDG